MRNLILACSLTLCCAATASAQVSEIRPGVRLRLEVPGILAGRPAVTVLSQAADSMVVGSPELAPITIPISRITKIDLSRGKSRSAGALHGAEWGAGIFGGLALLIASGTNDCSNASRCTTFAEGDRNAFIGSMAAGGAFYGVIIGAIVGKERWESFGVRPNAGVRVTTGSDRVGLTLAF